MHQGQSVYQNGHIVSVGALSVKCFILIDDLQAVVVNVVLVDEIDVFHRTVVACQKLNVIFLNDGRFLFYPVITVSNFAVEKLFPFGTVSYTHLDVYKRQLPGPCRSEFEKKS